MQYHHTGVVTDQKQPNEFYVEATKVWVTDPDDHPYRIEFLRFEPRQATGQRPLPHRLRSGQPR